MSVTKHFLRAVPAESDVARPIYRSRAQHLEERKTERPPKKSMAAGI